MLYFFFILFSIYLSAYPESSIFSQCIESPPRLSQTSGACSDLRFAACWLIYSCASNGLHLPERWSANCSRPRDSASICCATRRIRNAINLGRPKRSSLAWKCCRKRKHGAEKQCKINCGSCAHRSSSFRPLWRQPLVLA